MVEGSSKNPIHQELDEEITYGPVNIKQACEYTEILEKIIEDTREHLLAGQNDALQMMIQLEETLWAKQGWSTPAKKQKTYLERLRNIWEEAIHRFM